MNSFVRRWHSGIKGIISGFDRLVFRGSLRSIAYADGMKQHLYSQSVLFKDFSSYALAASQSVKESAKFTSEKAGREYRYLTSPSVRKDELAREIAKRDQVCSGLICTFSAVEPCLSPRIRRDRESKKLVLEYRKGKCLHVYQYRYHPLVGFMSARLQTWFPFNIQICINGREWLAKQMDAAGMAYVRRDNCFSDIVDVEQAQTLMHQQLKTAWPKLLDEVAQWLNPLHGKIFADSEIPYYWTAYQSEWATDLMFRSQGNLDAIYPSLLHHGMMTFQSPDVMRFLGQRLNADSGIHGQFVGEVVSDIKKRAEGARIKHRINGNSVKLYNKQGNILRVETTINEPAGFKVFRPKQGESEGELAWRPMRKGIADLKRRADVSQSCNDRYLEALGEAEISGITLSDLVDGVSKPRLVDGKRVRALNPWGTGDADLLAAISRGEFMVNGLRNRDIRNILWPKSTEDKKINRQRSAKVSRLFRILRGHGLIAKVPRSHRYHVTAKGRRVITALLSARNADVSKLSQLAA